MYIQHLDGGVQDTVKDLRDAIDENITDDFEKAQKNASDVAVPVAQSWGAHRSEGGLYWARYVRRDSARLFLLIFAIVIKHVSEEREYTPVPLLVKETLTRNLRNPYSNTLQMVC